LPYSLHTRGREKVLKILLVEDDLLSASVLSQLLAELNYTIDAVTNVEMAWQHIETYLYDLVILNIILPDGDGFSLCARLRSAGYTMPILLLTTQDCTKNRVIGLEAGADDYVVKPYEFDELIARIRSLLRRYRDQSTLTQEIKWEKICLDFRMNIVTYNQQPLRLTQKEYGLLEIFLRHPQQTFSRGALLDRVWSAGEFPSEDAVTTHIKGLRQKLKAAGLSQDPIETLYGMGYRLKPEPNPKIVNHPEPLPTHNLDDNSQELAKARVQMAIAEISKKLQVSLIESIALFDRVAIALAANKLEVDLRYRGFMEAHRLIGSLGSLGFSEGSAIARQIEQLLNSNFRLAPTDAVLLKELIKNLQTSSCSDLPKIAIPPNVSKLPLLLIVNNDPSFTRELQAESETWGMRVQIAVDLTDAKAKIDQETPDVILLDVILPNSVKDGLNLLNELTESRPQIAKVIMAAMSDLSDRVMVARQGGCSFIEKPIFSAEEVVNAITQLLLQRQNSDRPKVMIVDDDPATLQILATMLGNWKIEVKTLQDPEKFWQVLELTSPDLLILDLIMPKYSGLDLCQAVRTDPLWQDLPIVFLSAHGDQDTVRQILAAGADDYLSKPVMEADLQTRLLSRLQRSRNSRQIANFDGLTGVYTHRRGIQSLTQFLRLAKRNQQNFCMAILDLDFFKAVNDLHGHGMGDKALKQFGSLLRQYFRSEDVTMRWSNEEFVVGLYGADRQQSVDRLTKLLEIWQEQKFLSAKGESFGLTFSAGIAEYPQNGTNIEALYSSMNAALYQAKETGRNRIVAI
jgi:diguanylate cyclase (GGDEF)-like protein